MADDAAEPGALSWGGLRMWERAKHVAGKTLSWGTWGVGLGAAASLLLSPFTLATGAGTGLLGAVTGGLATGGVGGALTGGLLAGLAPVALPLIATTAVLGGIGFVSGLLGSGEAADEADEKSRADAERSELRQRRQLAMNRRDTGEFERPNGLPGRSRQGEARTT